MKIGNLKYIAALALFLLSTVGVWVNKHYSKGKVFDVSFFVAAESCCSTHCHCCKEETIVFQLSTEKISSSATQLIKLISVELVLPFVLSTENDNSILIFKKETKPPFLFISDTSPGVLQVFRC